MSAPHTNIKKQQRRHKGPLIGMGLLAVFVGITILYWTNQVPPVDPSLSGDVQTDGTDGAASGTDADPSADAISDPVQPAAITAPGNSSP